MDDKDLICKICANEYHNVLYKVREMMFGFRDEFDYFECSACGCLQIKTPPVEVSKYYPPGYYSFNLSGRSSLNEPANSLITYLRHQRTLNFINNKSCFGALMLAINPLREPLSIYLGWLKKMKADLNSALLDVGCGKGQFLLDLAWYGFKNLTGLDPYIEKGIVYENGVKVLKDELEAINARFDIIIFNHSLEHMPDQALIFSEMNRCLNKNGRVMIRMPTTSSFAWRNYGADWVQVDAPRHFFIHSLKSIGIMARNNGLKIDEITFDSSEFQFIGSEQYRQDIPLRSARSYYTNPEQSIFKPGEIGSFRKRAAELNSRGEGDQACVYLARI